MLVYALKRHIVKRFQIVWFVKLLKTATKFNRFLFDIFVGRKA